MSGLNICDKCGEQLPQRELGSVAQVRELKSDQQANSLERDAGPPPRLTVLEFCRRCTTELTGWEFE